VDRYELGIGSRGKAAIREGILDSLFQALLQHQGLIERHGYLNVIPAAWRGNDDLVAVDVDVRSLGTEKDHDCFSLQSENRAAGCPAAPICHRNADRC